MNILIITTRLPYPTNNGAKIRAFQIIKALACKHNVTLISYFGSEREADYFEVFSSMGVNLVPILNPAIDRPVGLRELITSLTSGLPLSVGKYNDQRLSEAIAKNVKGQDVIHCEHMHIAHYAFKYMDIPKVLDAHNVETQIAHRMTKCESNLLKKLILSLNSRAMRAYEKKVCSKLDLVLSVSPEDKLTLESDFGSRNVQLLENGVDVGFFHPDMFPGKQNKLKMVFVGAMDWLPNSDGVINFVTDTLPLIRKHNSAIQLDIVGKDPPESVISLGTIEGVRVTGTVDDVRPYIADSRVYVVPLRFGGGTRLKILEAFASGKPVVSTSLGCEGIACCNGEHLLIADTPVDFAASVIRLLQDQVYCSTLTNNARKLAVETYSWDVICAKILIYYEELLSNRAFNR